MNHVFARHARRIAIAVTTLAIATSAYAQHIRRISTFASGTALNATGPDSIFVTRHSVWVAYTNGADSTGLSGTSTIVEYSLKGDVRYRFVIDAKTFAV